MKCVVSGPNATGKSSQNEAQDLLCSIQDFFLPILIYFFVDLVLAKVIHSFARIGNELYVEADIKNGLSLRTVNMTKSAFSSILFNLDFFSSFVAKSKTSDENQCKLSMKSCLGVFRNMKQVCSLHRTFRENVEMTICFFRFAGRIVHNDIGHKGIQTNCAV